jgi:hypothetical protein
MLIGCCLNQLQGDWLEWVAVVTNFLLPFLRPLLIL